MIPPVEIVRASKFGLHNQCLEFNKGRRLYLVLRICETL